MNADAEHLIAYFIRSPWILVLIALGLMLVAGMIKGALRNRRYRRRALREKEYWRRKFESELPQILSRNRQIRELTGPDPVPLLDYDQATENESYVLSEEVLAVNHDIDRDTTHLNTNGTEEASKPNATKTTHGPGLENASAQVPTSEKKLPEKEFDVFNLPHSHPDSFSDSELESDELYDRKIRIVR